MNCSLDTPMTHTETHSQPLTIAQRGMWMANLIAPQGSTFNIAEAITLRGAIDEKLFIQALDTLALETETLRSQIVETPEGPQQRIFPEVIGRFPIIELSDSPNPEQAAYDWMNARIKAPINLASDQLWQNALIRVGQDHYIWFHCAHHAILDGFSAGAIAARLATIYNALLGGETPPPSPFLPVSNLLEQETLYRQSNRHETDRRHWLGYLANPPEPVTLSLRPQKTPSGEYGGYICRELQFSQAKVDTLASLAKAYDVSVPQALTALVTAYVARATESTDLLLGMPVSGRANRILRQTPGMVANATVLRFMVASETPFAEVMRQSKKGMLGALRHQQFRYEDLRRELGLFETSQQVARLGVNIEPFDYSYKFGEVVAQNRNLSNGAMEDLTIFVFHRQDGNGLTFRFDANPALYTEIELHNHIRLFDRFASSLIANPELPIFAHDLFDDNDLAINQERDRRVARNYPTRHLWPLLDQALASSQAPYTLADESHALDYRAVRAQIQSLGDQLKALGIGDGHLVGIALPRDSRMVVAMAAISMAGAAWLPLDIYSPPERALTIVEDAQPSLIITSEDYRATLPENFRTLAFTSVADFPDRGQLHGHFTAARHQPAPSDTAYITYTSGTTGKPKGVVISNPALANLLQSFLEILPVGPDTKVMSVTTLTFDIATLEIMLPILAGGSLNIASRESVLDPYRLTHLMGEREVTAIQATPTMYQNLLSIDEGAALADKLIMIGGEVLPPHIATRLLRLTPDVYNLYGPTETTIWSTWHKVREKDLEQPPVGTPIANPPIQIIDSQHRALPDGLIGELAIGGDGVATGYLNRQELTAERFIQGPSNLAQPQLIYLTGDRAIRDLRGTIRVIGRTDDQIKIRGMRIEPGEIETQLLDLPGVAQAAVVAEKSGPEVQAILAAYIVFEEGTEPAIAELRHLLGQKLPAQMVPSKMVAVDHLPRTPAGKLDRNALKRIEVEDWQQKPEGTITLARTPAEKMLADIWSQILGIKNIDIHTSFFDLGGESLMVIRMVSMLSERGYSLPVGQIFSVPTIAALAPLFEQKDNRVDPFADVLPIKSSGSGKPIFCIHPVLGIGWAFSSLAPRVPEDRPLYALQHARPILKGEGVKSMGELAYAHLAHIRQIQPKGPYTLIGWSMGGLLAHNIASILESSGDRVELVTLLDAYPYHGDVAKQPLDSPLSIKAAIDFLAITIPPEGPYPNSMEELADIILRTEIEAIPTENRPDEALLATLTGELRQIATHNIDIIRQYEPRKVTGNEVFIRATQRTGSSSNTLISDSSSVWRNYNTKGLRLYDIDCRHQDMLLPDNARRIVDILFRPQGN